MILPATGAAQYLGGGLRFLPAGKTFRNIPRIVRPEFRRIIIPSAGFMLDCEIKPFHVIPLCSVSSFNKTPSVYMQA